MNLRWCQVASVEESKVGEEDEERFYNRMLWAIPEDEEDSANYKARHPILLLKKNWSPHQGRDCSCNKGKNNDGMDQQQIMIRPKFFSPSRRRNARVANAEFDSKVVKSTDDKYPASLIPPRRKADEEELSYQCDEIRQLYQAVSQGKLSIDNLRLLGLLRI